MKYATILLLLLSLSVSVTGADPTDFLKTNCIRCHGPKKQKSDRRFDGLPLEISTLLELESWQEIVDQLNLEAMPPEDQPQPTSQQRAAFIANATKRMAIARQKLASSANHSVLRRLNAWEYQNTVGDLLHLNVQDWNPAEEFPAEVKVDGFDNNGAGLVTSGMLLEKYLVAAEQIVERATNFEKQPKTQLWTQKSPFYFDGKEKNALPKLFHVDRFRFIPETPYTDLYARHYRGGHIGFRPLANQGVQQSGRYRLHVRAAAVDRDFVYESTKGLDDFRSGDPLVLEVAAVDRKGSVESTGNISRERALGRVELTNTQPKWFQWDVFMEKGFEPEVRFANGAAATKAMIRKLQIPVKGQQIPLEFRELAKLKAGTVKSHGILKAYRGPKLRIYEIKLEGPLVEVWPPRGHQLLYGKRRPDEIDAEFIDQRLESFATLAFRRPLRPAELDPIKKLVKSKIAEVEPIEAFQLGVQAILCAPGFLYFDQSQASSDRLARLSQFALAERLSYFLWSSMPDDQLIDAARKGQLSDSSQLNQQVNRMLADPKSNRFVSHFVRRWLDLDNIGEMPPSGDFKVYYRDNLGVAMRRETESFFRHVLMQNLKPGEFLSADYSFLNRELALHYGIKGVEGSEMQRVSLRGTRRGGLLGQALFLTASANGVDTSPVVRGIYVLEKLLGYSPPPPPPDVPSIESDIRGATTIRQQLAKHRSVESCAECHRKIDPLGFALENFDAIGGWRDEYGKNLPVDASGQLPGGDSFEHVDQFRRHMIQRNEQFSRCMTEKLFTYALGRNLGPTDRPHIDKVVAQINDRRGMKDLIKLIVQSELFATN